MIKSMTGFGRGEASAGPFTAKVELRSVNHRFADLRLKLPSELHGLETVLNQRARKSIYRGHVELNVSITRGTRQTPPFVINRPVVDSYLKAARQLKSEYRLGGEITVEAVFALPDAIRVQAVSPDLNRREQAALLLAVDRAIARHDAMRIKEGKMLARDIKKRVDSIGKARSRIEKRAPQMVPLYAKRLDKRIRELNGSGGHRGGRLRIDESRLAQEVALVAERSDVTEELVRLAGHLDQLRDLMASKSGPVGKKLDFIMQEMNREANTINSKAIDLVMCQHALEVKAEVEKIREQVQNVE